MNKEVFILIKQCFAVFPAYEFHYLMIITVYEQISFRSLHKDIAMPSLSLMMAQHHDKLF